jgi:hypothetical protein
VPRLVLKSLDGRERQNSDPLEHDRVSRSTRKSIALAINAGAYFPTTNFID